MSYDVFLPQVFSASTAFYILFVSSPLCLLALTYMTHENIINKKIDSKSSYLETNSHEKNMCYQNKRTCGTQKLTVLNRQENCSMQNMSFDK